MRVLGPGGIGGGSLDRPIPLPLANGAFLRGAHHPHCPRHNHHLIWIFGHPLCLGCTCLYSGAALGVLSGIWLDLSSMHWLVWCTLHAALVLPTVAQPWVQRKWYKIVARTLVGGAAGSFWLGLLWRADFPGPRVLWIGALGIGFVIVVRAMLWVRLRKPNDPCNTCPLGTYPTCDWNLPRLLGDATDPILLDALNSRLQDPVPS